MFNLPFPRDELDSLLEGLENEILALGGVRNLTSAGAARLPRTPEEIGRRLFDALFHGPVRDSFLQSRERVRARPDTGLRLRLVLDPDSPGGAVLASLPWELLYRHETRDYLSRDLYLPVVRFLVAGEPPTPDRLDRALRILLVSASPEGAPPLDLREEGEEVETTWKRHGVELRHLRNPTMDELHETLRRESPTSSISRGTERSTRRLGREGWSCRMLEGSSWWFPPERSVRRPGAARRYAWSA